ncbi:MAG: HTH domain-containing protein [Anaeromyxobacter sp.]
MTFTEAALEVLRREGKPLHFKKIVELAIRENLLDHVGKIPEETMADQLVAHARLPKAERRMLAVQHGTFALTEWGLDEDPAGIDNLVEAPVEDLPIRGRERHPIPLRDLSRRDRQEQGSEHGKDRGKDRGGRRRDEDGHHGRRYPPPAEVAFEILAGAGQPLDLASIAAQGAERLLMADAFVRDTGSLRSALLEDNRRRESAGRKALFALEGDLVTLAAQPEPGERVPLPSVARGPLSASELRRGALAALRRRLRECDPPTVEHVAGKLLEAQGFKELKVAKRGREHVIYTARRRMGLSDVRHAVRILRSGAEASRRDVTDLRRDLGHYGAQIGVVLTAGEANREARGEAGAAGQLPVLLVCGEAFAEALAEANVGTTPVVVPELDDGFFRAAAEAAEKEEAARVARREERDRRREERGERDEREPRGDRERREPRELREPREPREAREPVPVVAAAAGEGVEAEPVEAASGEPRTPTITVDAFVAAPGVEPAEGEGPDDEGDDGDDDGPDDGEGAEGEAGAPGAEAKPGEPGQGERRRRRRRRRRRGGRGRGREGQAAGPQGEGAGAGGPGGGPPEAAAAPSPPPPANPSGGEPPPAT